MSQVCFVTAYPPSRHELGGSGWIDRRLLSALRDGGADLEIVSVTGPGPVAWSGVPLRTAGAVPLEIRHNRRMLARVAVAMLVSAEPYIARKFTAFPGWSAAAALLRERADGRKVLTSGWPALVLASAAGCRVDAHVAHNVESVVSAAHAPGALRVLGENLRAPRAERRLLSRASRVLTLSRTDATTLHGWGIAATPLPLPLRTSAPESARTKRRRAVGFIGKLAWPPNATALETLLGPVHEELDRRGVDVPFVLAGTGTEVHRSHPRVMAAGRVGGVEAFYDRVDLVAVPRFGASTGVSVKVLEAAEFGVASVVPAALADAIDPCGPWFVADDPQATADAVQRWVQGAPPATDPVSWATGGQEAAREALAGALGLPAPRAGSE